MAADLLCSRHRFLLIPKAQAVASSSPCVAYSATKKPFQPSRNLLCPSSASRLLPCSICLHHVGISAPHRRTPHHHDIEPVPRSFSPSPIHLRHLQIRRGHSFQSAHLLDATTIPPSNINKLSSTVETMQSENAQLMALLVLILKKFPKQYSEADDIYSDLIPSSNEDDMNGSVQRSEDISTMRRILKIEILMKKKKKSYDSLVGIK
ncbi:hypothetical protein M0R45_008794 [Rubus argutus]|uniref:Uncharacterized protein n=1 Tax=Rubus argutus TaxID=59490 RepID=A0AAW1Y360_RUBAR